VSEPRPQSSLWPSVVAFLGLLAFIAFLIWLAVAR
jgi:hypothetical protein